MGLEAIKPEVIKEYFIEYCQNRISFFFGGNSGLLVDVEEDRFCRKFCCPEDIALQNFVRCLGCKHLGRSSSVFQDFSTKDIREHLEQVRFSRSEETMNPYAVDRIRVSIF